MWLICLSTSLSIIFRSCRYPLFCGNAVIREEAYCYVKNSPCELWYQKSKLNPQSFIYVNQISSENENVSSATQLKQHIFGHNKYFTEDMPIPLEDSAHILNINIGNREIGEDGNTKPAIINRIKEQTDKVNQRFDNDVFPLYDKLLDQNWSDKGKKDDAQNISNKKTDSNSFTKGRSSKYKNQQTTKEKIIASPSKLNKGLL